MTLSRCQDTFGLRAIESLLGRQGKTERGGGSSTTINVWRSEGEVGSWESMLKERQEESYYGRGRPCTRRERLKLGEKKL